MKAMRAVYEKCFSEAELPKVVKEIQELAPHIRRWLLYGPMGVGKTTLIRSWVGEEAASPTFTYIHEYSHAVHVDLYRFSTSSQSRWMDLYALFERAPLIFIEWAEKLPDPPPEPWGEIHLSYGDEECRCLKLFIRDTKS
ncbi:MAG: tRNA (adenosine(37)-N6)-threonylcarbamoyltransferase complex ATPase subunit type 1 TsaE [Bacteroidia bacterium]